MRDNATLACALLSFLLNSYEHSINLIAFPLDRQEVANMQSTSTASLSILKGILFF